MMDLLDFHNINLKMFKKNCRGDMRKFMYKVVYPGVEKETSW